MSVQTRMNYFSRIAPAVTACFLLALGIGVLSAHGTSKAPARCGAGGPGTVYDDPEVRVFTQEVTDFEERTIACSHINGRRTRLAQDRGKSVNRYVENVTAPGTYLGFSVDVQARGTGKACIVNIQKGTRNCRTGLRVLGLGATRAGSLAWLTYDRVDNEGHPICCAVYEKEQGAEVKQLDSGPDIEQDSFAVGGNRIYWTKAGEPQSATMP